MKKLVLLAALLFSFATTGFSQIENSLLWEVSGNGLEQPSYIFGTIHVKCPEDIKLSDEAQKAFDKASRLVLEIDMDDPNFTQKMQALSVNEGMKNISDVLEPDELNLLNEFYQTNFNADLSRFGVMKPFVLLSLISMKSLDCPQPGSYEAHLMQKATAKNWSIEGLENPEDQVKIFDKIPLEKQVDWLVELVEDHDAYKAELAKMIEAYDKENISVILNTMKDDPQYTDLFNDLFEKRNRQWIGKIKQYASEKPSFFAVGAGHLPESYGVVQLLKDEGYTVKAL